MIIIKLNRKVIQIFTITSITSIILLFTIISYSEYKDITIEQSFTYEDGYWKPGRVESKDFYINNNKKNDISVDRLYINLKSSECWKTGEKLDINSKKFKEFAKYSTVTLKHGNNVLFKDNFENILSKDGINLSKDIYIKSEDRELLNMTVDMDLEMNNDAQALNNVFTIGVAYTMEEDTFLPSNPDGEGGTDEVPPSNPDGEGSTDELPPSNPDGEGSTDEVPPSNPDGEQDKNESSSNKFDDSIETNSKVEGDSLDKLPQTGKIINSASLMLAGSVSIGTGIILNKKSKEKGGGKHNE